MNLPTVIIGASPQKERYSYRAYQTLEEKGLPFILVNPRYQSIDGHPVVLLSEVAVPVGTVSVYLSPERQEGLEIALAKLRLQGQLETSGIRCINACTLVLLRTGQF
jgi:predicted CoA-binding protein